MAATGRNFADPGMPRTAGYPRRSLRFASSRLVSDDEIMQIIKKRCVTYHSENPTHTMFLNQPPPKDLAFDSIDEVLQAADRIIVQVVQLKRMPLGNETAMENEERAKFDAWITASDAANR